MARVCKVGGQAVMEGVMMRAPEGIAIAVRKTDGTITREFQKVKSKAKKGTFLGLPIVRGVVAFVESLTIGMRTITRSTEMLGIDFEEPSKFEKWLAKVFGTTIDKIVMIVAVILAIGLAVGLFMLLPTFVTDIIFGEEVSSVWKSLSAGVIRLLIFIGYLLLCSQLGDIKRVFMYHGAEHKTIACYEAEEELTPENALKHKRLHPRCGTNYMFLTLAVSILLFTFVGWSDNKLILYGTRILLLPVVAGISYEVLQFAAKFDNFFTRIIKAPGMGLQFITTKEPTLDMIEVAIAAFDLAMDPELESKKAAEKDPVAEEASQNETNVTAE